MFTSKDKKTFLDTYLADPGKFLIADRASGLKFLVSFFNVLRKDGASSPQQSMEKMIEVLEQSPSLLNTLQLAILLQLNSTDLKMLA